METAQTAASLSCENRRAGASENVKERIVEERGYDNIKLNSEDVAEFEYRPGACKKSYRMVVVRKNLSVEKGQEWLFDDYRYFFYITNMPEKTREEIVFSANERCDQENVIGQLKSGIHALRMPSDDLHSNWAYMVIASLAWTFKSWYALQIPDERESLTVLRMEFKKFLQQVILIPCQIVRTGRRLIYRILAYNPFLETFFATFDRIRKLSFI